MKHIKSYKLFESDESIEFDLEDIFLEVNDDSSWKASVYSGSKGQKYYVIIQTQNENAMLKNTTLPNLIIESIKRSIDFMKSNGFSDCIVTLEDPFSEKKLTSPTDLDSLENLDMKPDNYIRIEFSK